jgi:molybdopterin-containing oxidoreductase family molybdopterin binding subunit
VVYQEKVVDSPGEVLSDMNFARLLAKKLYELIPELRSDIDTYFYKTEAGQKVFKTDWDYILECITPIIPNPRISELNLKRQKIVRWQDPDKIFVSLTDPSSNVVTTGITGRLEFFCNDPRIFAKYPFVPYLTETEIKQIDIKNEYFPHWVAPDESWNGPGATAEQLSVANEYPFIYMQEHTKWRVHTQWTNIPWLRELDPEPIIKLNPKDAAEYGIQAGDMVRIKNSRGQAVFRAVITAQLPRKLINVPKGWQRFKNLELFGNEPGYDKSNDGGYNDLTNPKMNPFGVDMLFYDARVKIEKL